jgi:hypothetical protein
LSWHWFNGEQRMTPYCPCHDFQPVSPAIHSPFFFAQSHEAERQKRILCARANSHIDHAHSASRVTLRRELSSPLHLSVDAWLKCVVEMTRVLTHTPRTQCVLGDSDSSSEKPFKSTASLPRIHRRLFRAVRTYPHSSQAHTESHTRWADMPPPLRLFCTQ